MSSKKTYNFDEAFVWNFVPKLKDHVVEKTTNGFHELELKLL